MEPESRIPVILTICLDPGIPYLLNRHFNGNNRRIQRLTVSPFWIFLDLGVIFSSWPEIWDFLRSRLSERTSELHSTLSTSALLEMTKDLHLETANVIALQEDLRLQISTAEKYQSIAEESRIFQPNIIKDRLRDYLQNLVHQKETSQLLLRQFENLIALVRFLVRDFQNYL